MNSKKPRVSSRRTFCKAASAFTIPLFIPSHVIGKASPSEKITVAFIGTGNQGVNDLKGFLQLNDIQVTAVCDVNKASYGYKTASQFLGREPAGKIVDDFYSKKKNTTYKACDIYSDFRDVIDRKDIDAVVIVVPDHWHAVMSVWALRSGKDVYCEKPMTLTISEGWRMIEAVGRYDAVFQTGSHERSNFKSRYTCQVVRNGYIGELKRIITTVGPNNKTAPPKDWKPTPVPEGFDYDMWLGPAPWVPYHKDRCLYNFRFGIDYSGGQTTNYGAHSNDLAQWGNDTELTGPVEIEDMGSVWPKDGLFTTATKVGFRAVYKNGVELICKTGPENMQIKFEGTEGWIQQGYRGFSCHPDSLKDIAFKTGDIRLGSSTNHYDNFIKCVRSRQQPAAPVEIGHRSASLCHLGNIAMKLKTKLKWDPDKERFIKNDMANRMLYKPYRSPWYI